MTFPLRKSPSGPKADLSSGPISGWALIPAQSLPATPPFAPVPGVIPIVFSEWNDGDVLDGELFISFGGDPPAFVNAGFSPEISLDDGVTWHHLMGGTNIVAAGFQVETPNPAGVSSSMGFAVALPGGTKPQVRVAYGSVYPVVVGGDPPNTFTSFLRVRRIDSGSYVGAPPNTIAP